MGGRQLQRLAEGLLGRHAAGRERPEFREPRAEFGERPAHGLACTDTEQQFRRRVQLPQAQRRIDDEHGGRELFEYLPRT